MKSATRFFGLAAVVLICGAIGASAADLELTGVNAGYVMGGVYTSPYAITVDGTPMLLICDDFLTNISVPTSWTAVPTSLADLQAGTNPSGTPKWCVGGQCVQGSNGPAALNGYVVAAVLASQLLELPTFYSETAGELSYAIWGVFDPVLLTNNPSSGEGHLTTDELSAAQGYLSAAEAVVSQNTNNGVINVAALPQLTIYTPNPLTASQEFLSVQMDEAPLWVIMLANLVGVAGLIALFRSRVSNPA